MQRILQGVSATLTHTFYVDGAAANPSPDSATYSITRADGSVVASGSATEAGTGLVSVTLTPAMTALLDTLSVSYSATFGGQLQSFTDIVEIAGGFLFTIAQAKARFPSMTTAQVVDARTLAEDELEAACGVAFVPRFATATVSGDGYCVASLPKLRVRRIRWYTSSGTPGTGSEVSAVTVDAGQFLHNSSSWLRGYGNVIVGYEHGYDYPPAGVAAAGLDLMAYQQSLLTGAIDPRASSLITDDGTLQLGGWTASGAYAFGVPTVDRIVSRYGEIAIV